MGRIRRHLNSGLGGGGWGCIFLIDLTRTAAAKAVTAGNENGDVMLM